MSTTIKVKIEEITPNWLSQLQHSYGNALLEIKVHDKKADDHLAENDFWAIINLLNWKEGNNTNAIIRPAVDRLKELSVEAIFQFQDILAQKLYELDQQKFAEHIGNRSYGGNRHFSVDTFLYARASVVANGEIFYKSVLNNASKMPKEFTFEALLYLAAVAFTKKTGDDWSYLPTPSYETYTNSAGWGGKSWMDAIC